MGFDVKKAYNMYHRQIISVSYHCAGNIQDAEDIAQNVFVKFSKIAPDVGDDFNVRAWLYRVAVNECIDRKRSFKRALQYLFDSYGKKEQVLDSKFAKKVEMNLDLKKLLNRVNEKTRIILILKFLQEMEYEEISKIMNMPVGTLKSIVSRGLKQISGRNKNG